MAKFYVQSGTFRRVVAADSCRKAALWAVHEVMQQIMPTDAENDPNGSHSSPAGSKSADRNGAIQNVTVLSAKVRVDERGFDRHDARELSTMEVVAEWNQMVMTLDRLQRMLEGTAACSPTPERRFSQDEQREDRFADDAFFDDLAA